MTRAVTPEPGARRGRADGVEPRATTPILRRGRALIAEAAATGARLIALPEYFCLMGMQRQDKVAIREPLGRGPIQEFLAGQARQHGSGWSAARYRSTRLRPTEY